jgi:hypothetical protein
MTEYTKNAAQTILGQMAREKRHKLQHTKEEHHEGQLQGYIQAAWCGIGILSVGC